MLLLIDNDLRIAYCSVQFLELINAKSLDEIKGEHILDVYRGFADEEFIDKARRHIQKVIREKKTVVWETSITIKTTGKLRIYSIQTALLKDRDDAASGFCVVFHDVTSVMNARRKTEEAVRVKRAYLARTSREIRASVNAVLDTGVLMRTDNLDGEQKRCFSGFERMKRELSCLSDDILGFSEKDGDPCEASGGFGRFDGLTMGGVETEDDYGGGPAVAVFPRLGTGDAASGLSGTSSAETASAEEGGGASQAERLRLIRGLNVENGVSYTGGVVENYLEVLRQFCRGFDERKTKILLFLKRRDWENYLVQVHLFKGVTAIIGIQRLSDKAGELEGLAKKIMNLESRVEDVEETCAGETRRFLSSLNTFKGRVDAILGDSKHSAGNPISAPDLVEKLKALEEACQAYKAKQAAETAEELAGVSYSKIVDKEIGEATGLVSALEYEQAAEKIGLLLEKLSREALLMRSRILIIDDDKVSHMILGGILEPECRPIFAFTAEEAFAAIEREKPDVVLLDVMLPDVNGFEVLKELKSKAETASIPVILITALNNFEDEEMGLSLGAVDFITKPFRPTVVKARIRTQLRILQHFSALEKAGFIDELTGVPNRRCFNDRISMAWKRAERECKTLSFCMIDVDKFKEYNDKYGHLQGDVLLKAVAGVFAASARRAMDLAARLGGEEFGLLLVDASLEAAVEIAEQVRRNVQSLTIPTDQGVPTFVTVSIGVASIAPSAALSYNSLMERADSLLYLAKGYGRNRVCSSREGGSF
jgi:diguanylate cyclase (GGDEF)-like protein